MLDMSLNKFKVYVKNGGLWAKRYLSAHVVEQEVVIVYLIEKLIIIAAMKRTEIKRCTRQLIVFGLTTVIIHGTVFNIQRQFWLIRWTQL